MRIVFMAQDEVRDASALVAAICRWRDRECDGSLPGFVQLDPVTWRGKVEQLSDAVRLAQPMLHRHVPMGHGHYLPAGDARLRTLCGRRSDGVLMTTGKAGALVYGPYVRLVRGSYEMKLYGTIETAAGAHLDVVSENGTRSLLEGDLVDRISDGAYGGLLFSRRFALDHDVEDLEVRVHVGATTVMCVRAIEVLTDRRSEALVQAK
jgi:hypothetical protein